MMMECERWLQARINDLRRRSALDQNTNVSNLPKKLQRNFTTFNTNELNMRGESLILSVVKYEPDKVNQIRYISMLVRSGCDPSIPDVRQLRTPLMVACIKNNEAVALHLISLNCNLVVCDRLGNNALMYATMYCQAIVVKRLMVQLASLWAFEAYTTKNCAGLTAESIAKKNDRILFAKMLRRERKRMASRLRIYVASHEDSPEHYQTWNLYAIVFKACKKFRSLRRPANYCMETLKKSEASTNEVYSKSEINTRLSRRYSMDQIYHPTKNRNTSTVRIEKDFESAATLPKIAMNSSSSYGKKTSVPSTSEIREALSI